MRSLPTPNSLQRFQQSVEWFYTSIRLLDRSGLNRAKEEMTQSSDSIEPIVLDAKQAAAYITISLRKLDDLQAAGYLRPLRIGRNRLFPREQLHALLKRAATEKIG